MTRTSPGTRRGHGRGNGRTAVALLGAAAVCGGTLLAPGASSAAGAAAGAVADGGAAGPSAAAVRPVLQARPGEVDFRTKRVGTENYKRTRITNTGRADVLLVVEAGLPDDFGFGLMPGQTCPVFSPGEVLAAGESCYAVVRFSPTEGFIGWPARGELIARASDPKTSAVVETLVVPVLGTAVP